MGYHLRERSEPVVRRNAGDGERGMIAIDDQGQLPELLSQETSQHPGCLTDQGAVCRCRFEDFRLLQKLKLQIRLFRGGLIVMKDRLKLAQSRRHTEKPAAPVDSEPGPTAEFFLTASGKPGEAHYLSKKREPVSANAAQLSFRFMAILFGNEEDFLPHAPFHIFLNLTVDPGGFPAPDLTENELHTLRLLSRKRSFHFLIKAQRRKLPPRAAKHPGFRHSGKVPLALLVGRKGQKFLCRCAQNMPDVLQGIVSEGKTRPSPGTAVAENLSVGKRKQRRFRLRPSADRAGAH